MFFCRILGARLPMIVSLCFYLSGKRARAITQRVFETGMRFLGGDQGLYEEFNPSDDFCPQSKLCLVRNYASSKERGVFEFIKREFGAYGWVFNQRLGENCLFRPDAMLKMESHTVIVEVDEGQHKQYDSIDEVSRMQQLHKSLGTPTIFIRFNPGVYIDEYKKKHDPCWGVNSLGEFVPSDEKEWNHRLHTLKTCISKHKDIVPFFWHQTFLFFDGDDDARGKQAKAFVTALENF